MGMVRAMENIKSFVNNLLEECDRHANHYISEELNCAKKALELSKSINYDIGIFESHFRIARSLMSSSNNEEAIEHLDVCYAIAQTLGDAQLVARTANSFGISYYNLGITSKSLDHLLEALELSKTNQYRDIECRVYNNICAILCELGDFETAIGYLQNILGQCEQADPPIFPKCIVYKNLADTYYNMNNIGKAEFYAIRALDESLKNRNSQMLCETYYIMGQIRARQKLPEEAYSLMQKAMALAEMTSNSYYLVQIRIDLSKLFYDQNRLIEASNIIREAYGLAFQLDYPALKRSVALTMAEICQLTRDERMLIKALKAFKDITLLMEKENIHRQQVFTKAQLLVFNLKKDNERLRGEIERDPLTGCLSSRTFPDRITQSLATYGNTGALIFLDIDNLKIINDSYGHDIGDALLISFVKDLMAVMPQESLKIRIAGDEFLVFLPKAGRNEAAAALDNLLNTLKKPRMVGEVRMPVLVSAGIALYPEHSSDLINLRKMADAAMYSAKQAGRGNYRIYNAS